MKTLKYLPLTVALLIAGCTEMTPPGSEAVASAPPPTMAAMATAPGAMAAAPATPEPMLAAASVPSSVPMPSTAPPATATTSAAPVSPTRTKHSAAVVPAPIASGASASNLAKGEKIYTATCVTCHGAGVLGAPKFGDKAMWGPRIAQGINTLHTNAINGIRLMPPKGGNATLKDEDVKAAVDYMVNKAG